MRSFLFHFSHNSLFLRVFASCIYLFIYLFNDLFIYLVHVAKMKPFQFLCLSLLTSTSLALPATTSTSANPAQSTACGDIVNDPGNKTPWKLNERERERERERESSKC